MEEEVQTLKQRISACRNPTLSANFTEQLNRKQEQLDAAQSRCMELEVELETM